jgi:hypothetical protein
MSLDGGDVRLDATKTSVENYIADIWTQHRWRVQLLARSPLALLAMKW